MVTPLDLQLASVMSFNGSRSRGGGRHSSNTKESFASRGGVQKRRGGGARFDSDGETKVGRDRGGRGRGDSGQGGANQNRGGGAKQSGYQKGTFSGRGK